MRNARRLLLHLRIACRRARNAYRASDWLQAAVIALIGFPLVALTLWLVLATIDLP